MSRVQGWLVLADAIREAGAAADPADAARELREAGASVTRNSRAQWVADPKDPRVIRWWRDLEPAAPSRVSRGTGRHVLPPPSPRRG